MTAHHLDHLLFAAPVPVVFLAIEKVGCSALKRWMIGLSDPTALSRPGLRLHPYCLEHFALSGFREGRASEVLRTHPILAFVRDPMERLRSAFIDKFVYVAGEQLFPPALDLLTRAGVSANRGLSFREFIRTACSLAMDDLDPHWRPQSAFFRGLPSGNVTIFPLEWMERTLREIAAAHGRPGHHPPTVNVTDKDATGRAGLADMPSGELHRLHLRPPTSELVDDEIAVLVRTAFAEDYSLQETARAAADTGMAVGAWIPRAETRGG